jgi:cobalt-zinc-cadmium resistance protein CzcA
MIWGQQVQLDLDQLKELTLNNNHLLMAGELKVESSNSIIQSAFTFEPTELFYAFDENDIAINGLPNHKFGFQQNFDFPTVYGARKSVFEAQNRLAENGQAYNRAQLLKSVTKSYYSLLYLEKKRLLLEELINLYSDYAQQAKLKYESGESTKLESLTAKTKQQQLLTSFNALEKELQEGYLQLKSFVQVDTIFQVDVSDHSKYENIVNDWLIQLGDNLSKSRIAVKESELKVKKQEMLPGFSVNYFIGSNRALDANLQGYQVGLKLPLLYVGDRAEVKSKRLAITAAKQEYEDYQWRFNSYREQLEANMQRYQVQLNYFDTEGLRFAEEITTISKAAYDGGEINFFNYTGSLEDAMRIKLDYLETLNNYNQTAIELNYAIIEL